MNVSRVGVTDRIVSVTLHSGVLTVSGAYGERVAGGSAQGGVGAPQKNGTTSASASGGASADANAEYKAPPEYSAEGKTKLEAMYADARSKRVPVGAMARRVAEGRA